MTSSIFYACCVHCQLQHIAYKWCTKFNVCDNQHETVPSLTETEIIESAEITDYSCQTFRMLSFCQLRIRQRLMLLKNIWKNMLHDKTKTIQGRGNPIHELKVYLNY